MANMDAEMDIDQIIELGRRRTRMRQYITRAFTAVQIEGNDRLQELADRALLFMRHWPQYEVLDRTPDHRFRTQRYRDTLINGTRQLFANLEIQPPPGWIEGEQVENPPLEPHNGVDDASEPTDHDDSSSEFDYAESEEERNDGPNLQDLAIALPPPNPDRQDDRRHRQNRQLPENRSPDRHDDRRHRQWPARRSPRRRDSRSSDDHRRRRRSPEAHHYRQRSLEARHRRPRSPDDRHRNRRRSSSGERNGHRPMERAHRRHHHPSSSSSGSDSSVSSRSSGSIAARPRSIDRHHRRRSHSRDGRRADMPKFEQIVKLRHEKFDGSTKNGCVFGPGSNPLFTKM